MFIPYFDVQNRLTENLYTTFGMRFDEHSAAGNEDSHRVSFAYLTDDKKTKIKGSYGTVIDSHLCMKIIKVGAKHTLREK